MGISCSKVLGVSDVVAVEELAVVDNLHEHLKRSVGNLVIGDVGDTPPTRAGRAVVVSGRVIRVVHDVLDIEELSVVAAAGDLADIMSTAPIAQSLVLVICPSEHLDREDGPVAVVLKRPMPTRPRMVTESLPVGMKVTSILLAYTRYCWYGAAPRSNRTGCRRSGLVAGARHVGIVKELIEYRYV